MPKSLTYRSGRCGGLLLPHGDYYLPSRMPRGEGGRPKLLKLVLHIGVVYYKYNINVRHVFLAKVLKVYTNYGVYVSLRL